MTDTKYTFIKAEPSAPCPFCPANVRIEEDKRGALKARNQCHHFSGAEKFGGEIWCKFLRAQKET